jgi:type I restriction enzyme M protein
LADSDGDLSYAEFAENHRFQIPEGAHWKDVRQVPKNVGMAIQAALRQIESASPDMLAGIFGDAPWTNRERLPDETLKNLIEHFSTQTLSVANVPEDELGNAYEFLIKKLSRSSPTTPATRRPSSTSTVPSCT